MKLSSTQRMVQQLVSPHCSSKIFIILFLNFSAPGDFSEVTSLPVTFTSGSLVTTVSVTINEDSIHEANEVFTGNLRHVGVQRIQITEDEATVTITDDDGNYIHIKFVTCLYIFPFSFHATVAEIGFNPVAYTVTEDGLFVILTVVNRNTDLEREVVVQVGTVSGSAVAGM